MITPLSLLLSTLVAAVLALLAWRSGALSRSGGLAAWLLGTLIFGLGGWQWAVLLLAFFITSSILTRLFQKRKAGLEEKFEKGGRRDAGQVLANGGVAAIFAILHALYPEAAWTWIAGAASLAAVNADTWATELGVLNPSPPRLILNGRTVERGTSGAVSFYGLLAAWAGAIAIGLLAAALRPYPRPTENVSAYALLVSLAGFLGALVDSLLGANWQAIYFCPQCRKETEKHPRHTCGTPTKRVRGWKWLNNDVVNVLCALSGALIAILLLG